MFATNKSSLSLCVLNSALQKQLLHKPAHQAPRGHQAPKTREQSHAPAQGVRKGYQQPGLVAGGFSGEGLSCSKPHLRVEEALPKQGGGEEGKRLLQQEGTHAPMTLGLFSPGPNFYVTATLPQWSESGSFRQKELCREGSGGSGQQAQCDLWWA